MTPKLTPKRPDSGTLIARIEELGSKVERGELSEERAVELLAETGGFTPYGALDVMKGWRSVRRRYEDADRYTSSGGSRSTT